MSLKHYPLQVIPGSMPGRIGQRVAGGSPVDRCSAPKPTPRACQAGAFVFLLKEVTVCSKVNRKTASKP